MPWSRKILSCCFSTAALFLGVIGQVEKRQAVVFGRLAASVVVVGDDAGELAAHFAGAEAQNQIMEAMAGLGGEDRDARAGGGQGITRAVMPSFVAA